MWGFCSVCSWFHPWNFFLCIVFVVVQLGAQARRDTTHVGQLGPNAHPERSADSANLGRGKDAKFDSVNQLCSHLHPSSCSHKGGTVSVLETGGAIHHEGNSATVTMPLFAQRTFDTHPRQTLQLLEANHISYFQKGFRHLAYRGEGPFGSLGATTDRMRRSFVHIGRREMSNGNFLGGGMSFLESGAKASPATPTSQDDSASFRLRANAGQKRLRDSMALNSKHTSEGSGTASYGEMAPNAGNGSKVPLSESDMSIPIAQLRDSQYVGAIGVGEPPQYIHPIFDTGSTNVWVISENCKSKTCKKVTRFNKLESTTFKENDVPLRLDITFGTGKISGVIGRDTFHLGNLTVKDQSFGLVENEDNDKTSNIFELIDFEGIVGFAFPELSSTGKVPFFDNLLKQGGIDSSEIAFYMVNTQAVVAQLKAEQKSALQTKATVEVHAKGEQSVGAGSLSTDMLEKRFRDRPISAMFVGGVDTRFFEGPIHMLPVIREHYWEVKLDAMYIGDKKFCCDDSKPSYIIFDSGTSFNTLPSGEIEKFFQYVPPRKCDEMDPNFLDSFPTLKYTMSGLQVELTPEMYVVRSTDNVCKPAYMQIDVPSEFGHAYIFGVTSFMRHFYTVFKRGMNGDPSMIGFAPAKHSKEGISYLTDLISKSPGFAPNWLSERTNGFDDAVSTVDLSPTLSHMHAELSPEGGVKDSSIELSAAIYNPATV